MHIMKNIKLQIEKYLDFDGYMDFYEVEDISTVKDYPKRQGMSKPVQRSNSNKVDYYKKSWHNYESKISDNDPYYYANILLKKLEGKSVEYCKQKFKNRFKDYYSIMCFNETFKECVYKFGCRNNYVYDGIIIKPNPNRKRKQLIFYKEGYIKKYFDVYNGKYVSNNTYSQYIKLREEYNSYIRNKIEYNRRINLGVRNNIEHPIFIDLDKWCKLDSHYKLGFNVETYGDTIEFNKKSKQWKKHLSESRKNKIVKYDKSLYYDIYDESMFIKKRKRNSYKNSIKSIKHGRN